MGIFNKDKQTENSQKTTSKENDESKQISLNELLTDLSDCFGNAKSKLDVKSFDRFNRKQREEDLEQLNIDASLKPYVQKALDSIPLTNFQIDEISVKLNFVIEGIKFGNLVVNMDSDKLQKLDTDSKQQLNLKYKPKTVRKFTIEGKEYFKEND